MEKPEFLCTLLSKAIERVNSRLKKQLCLERHRARGLERMTIHALHNRHAPECTNSVKVGQNGKSQIHHYAREIKRKLTQRNRFSNTLARLIPILSKNQQLGTV